MEGDEEAGSPSLEAMVRAHGDRIRGEFEKSYAETRG
jgi:hypothetical protein